MAVLVLPGAAAGTAGEMNETVERLREDVRELSVKIGERNHRRPAALAAAADYIGKKLARAGLDPIREEYRIADETFVNIVAEKKGNAQPEEIILLGAHYDSVPGSPGADDNASGVAVLLELAREFGGKQRAKTLRCVAFVNEEPPFFRTGLMGSRVHAHACRQREERLTAMLSLEMLGYFTDEPGSQSYPPFLSFFYPDRGNFIAIVGNLRSRSLVKGLVGAWTASCPLPVESIATVSIVPGVDFSDHASFWKYGYRAAMVTDTAFYRYPYYHAALDTAERLDYERMAQAVAGLSGWLAQTLN
jgi:Zn-dependent M28 family amino/carboxypeptidase